MCLLQRKAFSLLKKREKLSGGGDICFTSPLSRARQTAERVLGKRDVPIIPDKRIQEINFGVLEGDQVRDAAGNYIDPQIETFSVIR